jgi:phage repressor protein C with HTH and peptisase S24 domain
MPKYFTASYLKPNSTKSMPLALSPLSAGDAAESSDDYELVDMNEMFTGGKEGYALYPVTGDSMVDEIRPGYLVIVDTFAVPCNGDIVASTVGGKLNVKILDKNPNGLFLVSKNKKYQPRRITERDCFQVIGVVVGHIAFHNKGY